ncbi:MAG: tyramine oxidase [Elusimicrobia bacterium]|nr:tyramine oxidase [Elusimicrobiota bacterium]
MVLPLLWVWASTLAAHPLDPLTARELERAAAVLRRDARFPKGAFFAALALEEPEKGAAPGRRSAAAVLLDRPANRVYEATVDLGRGRVARWLAKTGVQPGLLPSETSGAAELVRADPAWREMMRKRGITEFDRVGLDAWAPGTIGLEQAGGPRLARVLSFYQGRSPNFYARPVEGVVAVVDLTHGRVARVEDAGGPAIGPETGDYSALRSTASSGTPLALEREGRRVRWGGWSFRFALDAREGPVLYDVAREDGGRLRPVLYRASVSETVVPYGDPSPAWVWRGAFDAGELGLGRLAGPLTPGKDLPPDALALDAELADERGEPAVLPRALGFYTRDGGLLWKHRNPEPDADVARRARELVLTSVATIGNYDYAFSWVFREDGALEFQVEATGIMLAKGVSSSSHDPYSHPVSSGVAAPHHQHFFALRLDFDVDGEANRLYETFARPLPRDPQNPHGNAFAMDSRLLGSERAARRALDPSESRRWLVASGASAAEGHPAGYLVVPGENAPPLSSPGSEIRRRAGFLEHAVWATRHKRGERYAAGDYPNQAAGGDGVGRFGEDDESLVDGDLVLWYVLGVTHAPRPEEWPLMPAHRASVRFVPAGFYRRTPGL